MSVYVSGLVWKYFCKGGPDLLTLLALADWSDDDGRCWPAMASIAKKVRLSTDQARRVVRRLENENFIRVTGGKTGGATTRRYQINLAALTPGVDATPGENARAGMDATPPLALTQAPPLHSCASRTVIDTSMNRQKGGKPKQPRRAPPKDSPCPEDFPVTEAMIDWAAKEGFPAERIHQETETFLDWHRAKGSQRSDWGAAWRNWIRKAVGFRSPKPPVPDNNDELFRRAI